VTVNLCVLRYRYCYLYCTSSAFRSLWTRLKYCSELSQRYKHLAAGRMDPPSWMLCEVYHQVNGFLTVSAPTPSDNPRCSQPYISLTDVQPSSRVPHPLQRQMCTLPFDRAPDDSHSLQPPPYLRAVVMMRISSISNGVNLNQNMFLFWSPELSVKAVEFPFFSGTPI
jgi:hypothetical protein